MTDTPTPAPAGWYPAPDGSPTTWWWDGSRWTGPDYRPAQRPSVRSVAKLATATQVLLLVNGAGSLATIAIEVFGIGAITGYLGGNPSGFGMVELYDQGVALVSLLTGVAAIATAVLWAIWQYRAAKQVAPRTRRSAGWHAGSWFVPIINLWFPYQNISDLWRAVGGTRPPWQILWWLLWLVGNALIQQSTRIYLAAEDLDRFRVSAWVSIAGELLLLAAVPLAWMVVRGITQGIVSRSSAPAHSLVA